MASCSENIDTLTQNSPRPPLSRKSSVMMKRLFSTDSTLSTIKYTYELYPPANYEYSLCGRHFLLKISQVLLGVISAGLYSSGYKVMDYSVTSMMFPNVVFGVFIIISSVIALSYALGQAMPEILVRVYNAIGMILYFVSACITGHAWFGLVSLLEEDEYVFPGNMLLAQVFTTFVNAILYGADLAMSVKTALEGLQAEDIRI